MSSEGFPEPIIKIQWNNRFRKEVQVSPQNIRSIVDGISCPVKALAIPLR
jgi:hypothetical protein